MRLVPAKKDFGLSLFDDWDRFFDEPFFKNQKEMGLMKTDIKEKENEYVLEIDMPGFQKEDIKITMEDEYLVVSATKNKTNDEEEGAYLRKERFYGSCSRRFYLGQVDPENVRAQFQNGILCITMPKLHKNPEQEKKYIAIE